MKIKLPKLHNQILIGLVLSAIFGSIFKVNTHLLVVKYNDNNKLAEASIENWKKFTFLKGGEEAKEFSFQSYQQSTLPVKP